MNNEPDYEDNLAFDPHKQELLSQIANMELRDQLEAKEQMIKTLQKKLNCAEWCLHEIVENHRFTPKSTAENILFF